MVKFVRIFSIYFLVLGLQLVASEQLNLAIVYDENVGVLGSENDPIATDMRDLFAAQAAPILLSGNLALRAGLLFVPPVSETSEISDESDTRERMVKLENLRQKLAELKAAKNSKEKQASLCEALAVEKKALAEKYFLYAREFEKGEPHITVGQAAAHLAVLSQFGVLCEAAHCPGCVDDIAFYKKVVRKRGITPDNWGIYAVKNSPHHLTLFIPYQYARLHDAFDGSELDLEKLGFNQGALELVAPEDLAAKSVDYTFDPETIASSIQRIFILPSDKRTAPRWNIVFNGHGESPEAGRTPISILLKKRLVEKEPIKLSLSVQETEKEFFPIKVALKEREDKKYIKTTSFIAGIPGHEFLKLLDFWTILPTNLVVYATCFGGGANAEAIQQLFTLMVTLAQKSALDRQFPIVISVSGKEQVQYGIVVDYQKFFASVQDIFRHPLAQEKQKKLLKEAAKQLLWKNNPDNPIILFPRQLLFLTPERDEEGHMLATPAVVTAAATAAARGEGKFSYLVEPEYRLSTGADGQLNVRVQGTVKKTGSEIVFESKKDQVLAVTLETNEITKPLVFKHRGSGAMQVPNFDIKVHDDQVTFNEIKIPEVELQHFLTRGFSEHGKVVLVRISSLTAHHEKELLADSLPKGEITVTDVAIYALPFYMAPDRGHVLFTYGDTWYVFNLVADAASKLKPGEGEISLQFLETIAIPGDVAVRNALRENIIKQFESNGILSYALWSGSASAIVQWFGEPLAYPNLVQKIVLKHALDELTLDKDTWSHARAQLNSQELKNMDETLVVLGHVDTLLRMSNRPPATVSADVLARALDKIDKFSGNVEQAISSLSFEQKKSVLTVALSSTQLDEKSEIAAKLLKTGVLPEPSISMQALAKGLDKLYGDELTHAVFLLSAEQKKNLLAAALSSDKPKVAAELLKAGARPEASAPIGALVQALRELYLEDLSQAIALLNSRQKIEIVDAALTKNADRVAAELIKAGVQPTENLNRGVVRLLQDELPSLSAEQKNFMLRLAISAKDSWFVAYLLKAGAVPDLSVPASGLKGLPLVGHEELLLLSDAQKKNMLAIAISAEDSWFVANLLKAGAVPDAAAPVDQVVQALGHLHGEDLTRVVAALLPEQKTMFLAAALESYTDSVAAELMKAGAVPDATVNPYHIINVFEMLDKDATLTESVLKQILDSLSDEQKGTVFEHFRKKETS